MKHAMSLTVLILAAGLFFSCTAGEYDGTGGQGNLNIIDRTNSGDLNGKWISVEGEKNGKKIGFSPATPRKKFSGRKLSAPLYNLTGTGGQYIESDSFSDEEFTIKIYNDANDPSNFGDKKCAVTFYAGSGLIEYK